LLDPTMFTPEQLQEVKSNALTNALLGAGFQALAGSQALGYRPSTAQILGQAGQAGLQSYQGTFDQTLQNIFAQQKLQDAQRQRQQQLRQQQEMEAFVSGLPRAEQARFRAFPTQAAEAMFREPKTAPGVVGEFQSAVAAGLVPPETTLMQYVESKRPPGTTVNIGGENEFRKEVAKAEAKDFVAIKQSGQQAQRDARDINRLDTLLSKVETGGAAAFKQAAGNIGIKTEGLNDIQAAQAIINKLVPAQRPPGSGTMSDADLALYKESLPRIINQPGANKEILRSMREINNYLIEEGKIAAEVNAGRISSEEGTRRIFALGNPVQDFFDRTQGGEGLSAGQPMPQGDLDLINRYLDRGR
jgi:hypothetical protein